MAAQPRRLDASKPKPSSKDPSVSCSIGNVRWCHEPGRSVKRTETNLASWSVAKCKTFFAFIYSPGVLVRINDIASKILMTAEIKEEILQYEIRSLKCETQKEESL